MRFPLTWFKCTMARSYAVCTDLRTLGFFPSIKRSLSTVSSIPIGSSLFWGSHCLKTKKDRFQNTTSPNDVKIQHEVHLLCLNLTKFFWCQRTALRRAYRQLPFVSTRPVWAPPQEALGWGCRCEEALPGACLGQQSVTMDYVSHSTLNNYAFSISLCQLWHLASWTKESYSTRSMNWKIKYILTIAGYDGYPLHLAQTRSRGASSLSLSKDRSVDFPVNRIFQYIQLICVRDSSWAQTENLLELYWSWKLETLYFCLQTFTVCVK